jgi:hypothetical protein
LAANSATKAPHTHLYSCRSINGLLPPLPTAVQTVSEVQDTARSSLKVPSVGVDCTLHAVPSHASASVSVSRFVGSYVAPVAVQAVADEHETPKSRFSPVGSGVVCTAQEVPSDPAAKFMFGASFSFFPTALQAVDELHDRPNN